MEAFSRPALSRVDCVPVYEYERLAIDRSTVVGTENPIQGDGPVAEPAAGTIASKREECRYRERDAGNVCAEGTGESQWMRLRERR